MNEKCETDIFGNTWLTGSANVLKRLVKERFKCKVRAIELNTQQRCAGHIVSLCDITESVEIGRKKAVETAISGRSGVMMTFRRISTTPYKVEIVHEDVNNIANIVKKVPEKYLTPDKNNVTDECLKYIQPLILGEPAMVYKNGLLLYFKIV
ncbi:MAG: hypothetical protein FWD71_17865 [Oscillospiraceae bacterium]|nr:hypothetical protein [Oscillospiraceae bacterium]